MKRIVLEVERSQDLVLKTAELRRCINESGLKQKEVLDRLPQGWTMAILSQYIERDKLWHDIPQYRVIELARALRVDSIHIIDKPVKLKI